VNFFSLYFAYFSNSFLFIRPRQVYLLTRNPRYLIAKPTCISVGDIVELQVSFIMVPLRDNKFKPTMVLRSILVLDRTYTQVKILFLHRPD
jgi:hypothetical protein